MVRKKRKRKRKERKQGAGASYQMGRQICLLQAVCNSVSERQHHWLFTDLLTWRDLSGNRWESLIYLWMEKHSCTKYVWLRPIQIGQEVLLTDCLTGQVQKELQISELKQNYWSQNNPLSKCCFSFWRSKLCWCDFYQNFNGFFDKITCSVSKANNSKNEKWFNLK